jgi:hypothetical protein
LPSTSLYEVRRTCSPSDFQLIYGLATNLEELLGASPAALKCNLGVPGIKPLRGLRAACGACFHSSPVDGTRPRLPSSVAHPVPHARGGIWPASIDVGCTRTNSAFPRASCRPSRIE